MGISSDVRAARKVFRNIVNSRRARREVARRASDFVLPPRDTIEIAVYFADARVNLYQIRQWYAPLEELAAQHPVAIISRSPGSALSIKDETSLPVVYLRSVAEVERFVDQQQLRIVLYVNQNTKNFQMFRYGRMWHVFINHGESDKMYMTTNQFKAYDFAFIAGQAARDRLERKLWDFDIDRNAIEIGRPQADHLAGALPYSADDRIVVLYAPTWEGDRPAAAYGSIASHGVALAEAVLASPSHRLIYRPHPRSGVLDPVYKAANERIIAAIASANARDSAAQHVFDDGPTLGWQLAAADVAVTDISAMVYDRLATGRPIVVTRPVVTAAEVDEAGYLGSTVWLTAADSGDILAVVDRALRDPDAQATLAHWSAHHFGDTTPGSATRRFHEAIERLMVEWDRQSALHPDDSRGSESDPLDDEDDEGMPGD